LLTIEFSDPNYMPAERFDRLIAVSGPKLPALAVILALGNGFIITATLWAAFVVEMTEQRMRAAAAYLAAAALLCCFGIIHSVRPDGSTYVLWHLHGVGRQIAMQFCVAYLVLAAALLLLSLQRAGR
jgi:AGZA family xanthine/uracil permease-like MFS transporter